MQAHKPFDRDNPDKLTACQQEAVSHFEGPLLVLAGPGSGKTRVITNRVAALIERGVPPYNICAVTFTNKAADEMKQRVHRLHKTRYMPQVSTFHSLCVRILRQYADAARLSGNFTIYNEADQRRCMAEAIKGCGLDTGNFSPARMLDAVSLLKNQLQDPESFAQGADDFFARSLARIYERYEEILAERNCLDFDDLLMKTALLLCEQEDIRRELAERFKFLLVDEYQDTNHAQYQIARYLARDHHNICVTGDPDQSIYGWRGADLNNILLFEQDFPDAVTVKLEENFRSTPNILAVADRLIAANKSRKPKTLIPTRSPGTEPVLVACDDDAEEAESVAERIGDLLGAETNAGSIAVFYRVNAMSRPLEEAFIKARIPYQVVRGVEFYNRKEIRDILAYLKTVANPADAVSLLRIINTPTRGIGKTTVSRLADYARSRNLSLYDALGRAGRIDSLSSAARSRLASFREMLDDFAGELSGPVAPLIARVHKDSGLAAALKAGGNPDALDNIDELINAAALYDENTETPSLVDYLQQIALFTDSDAYDPQQNRVALMTLHCAKGLEFDNVFIVGLEQDILPHQRSSETTGQLEEERRLLFVGITRAKSGLYLSFARHRRIHGQLTRTMPSEFLFELGLDASLQEIVAGGESLPTGSAGGLSAAFSGPVASAAAGEFAPGQIVKHDVFGVGTVDKFVDMGADSIVVVRFKSGQKKSLLLKYANLATIDDA